MKRTLLIPGTLLLGMLFASCNKSSDELTAGRPELSYQINTTNNLSGLQKTTASAHIEWTAGFANPDMVKFKAKQAGTEIEYKTTNTSEVDLFAPLAVSFGGFTLPPGTYREIELKIKFDKKGPDPALQLSGHYTDGIDVVPVVFIANGPFEIKTDQQDVTITADPLVAVTTFDLAGFTDGITLYKLRQARLTNGTLVISADSNKDLYHIILDNITNRRHHCGYKHHH